MHFNASARAPKSRAPYTRSYLPVNQQTLPQLLREREAIIAGNVRDNVLRRAARVPMRRNKFQIEANRLQALYRKRLGRKFDPNTWNNADLKRAFIPSNVVPSFVVDQETHKVIDRLERDKREAANWDAAASRIDWNELEREAPADMYFHDVEGADFTGTAPSVKRPRKQLRVTMPDADDYGGPDIGGLRLPIDNFNQRRTYETNQSYRGRLNADDFRDRRNQLANSFADNKRKRLRRVVEPDPLVITTSERTYSKKYRRQGVFNLGAISKQPTRRSMRVHKSSYKPKFKKYSEREYAL
jgi:hypothetical protein